MRYDNVEQQIPRRILNRRLLNRSDGLHGPGRGDQPLPAAGANPLGGDLLRGFDIIRHSAVSREGAFCGLRTGLYRRHECWRCLPRS